MNEIYIKCKIIETETAFLDGVETKVHITDLYGEDGGKVRLTERTESKLWFKGNEYTLKPVEEKYECVNCVHFDPVYGKCNLKDITVCFSDGCDNYK